MAISFIHFQLRKLFYSKFGSKNVSVKYFFFMFCNMSKTEFSYIHWFSRIEIIHFFSFLFSLSNSNFRYIFFFTDLKVRRLNKLFLYFISTRQKIIFVRMVQFLYALLLEKTLSAERARKCYISWSHITYIFFRFGFKICKFCKKWPIARFPSFNITIYIRLFKT